MLLNLEFGIKGKSSLVEPIVASSWSWHCITKVHPYLCKIMYLFLAIDKRTLTSSKFNSPCGPIAQYNDVIGLIVGEVMKTEFQVA